MAIATITLRGRAMQAFLDDQALRDAEAEQRAGARLARLEHMLITELQTRLGIAVERSELHMISSGGVLVPAWKSIDDGLTFSLAHHNYAGGYTLHLVTYCDSCQERGWYRIRGLGDLGQHLAYEWPCVACDRDRLDVTA